MHRFHPIHRKGHRPVMRQQVYKAEGIATEILTFPSLDATGLVDHFFSTRIGGHSTGDCAEMNFNFRREADARAVTANYRRAAAILGGGRTIDDFVITRQTHSDHIRRVTAADRGQGVTRPADYSAVDALITNVPGIILTVYTADCVPVYLVDPVHRAIGLAHSGWRGTASKIAAKTLAAMHDAYGTDAADCVCAIGPSICRDCYEISEDVAAAFRGAFGANAASLLEPARSGHYLLDLWAAGRLILEAAGVPPAAIAVTDICTRCNSDLLFSHRAAGERRGNCCAFLSLR
jgi:YfiH family protein